MTETLVTVLNKLFAISYFSRVVVFVSLPNRPFLPALIVELELVNLLMVCQLQQFNRVRSIAGDV